MANATAFTTLVLRLANLQLRTFTAATPQKPLQCQEVFTQSFHGGKSSCQALEAPPYHSLQRPRLGLPRLTVDTSINPSIKLFSKWSPPSI